MSSLRHVLTLCLLVGALVGFPQAQGAGIGTVRGAIFAPGHGNLQGHLRVFTDEWKFLGAHAFKGGLYSLRLAISPRGYRAKRERVLVLDP